MELPLFLQNSQAALITRSESYIYYLKLVVKEIIENLAKENLDFSNPFVTDNPRIYIGLISLIIIPSNSLNVLDMNYHVQCYVNYLKHILYSEGTRVDRTPQPPVTTTAAVIQPTGRTHKCQFIYHKLRSINLSLNMLFKDIKFMGYSLKILMRYVGPRMKFFNVK